MPRLKFITTGVLGIYLVQGLIGWWMVKSGLKDKEATSEVDKTPRVSPYRLTVHGGLAYMIYAITLSASMNILRRPQENYLTWKNLPHYNMMRKSVIGCIHFLFFIYLYGFLTAGNAAGHACNTYPKIGEQ